MNNKELTILFDMDDTLYNLMDSFRKTHGMLLGDFKEASCDELFQTSRKYNKIAFDLWMQGKISKEEEFDYRIYHTYLAYGRELNSEVLEAFRINYREFQNHIQLMPGMAEILDLICREGVNLGLLTNGNCIDQQKKIDALALCQWIPKEKIFISEALPAPKPELEAFEYVENSLQLAKENIWYVGDTFKIDIVGAHQAGWHTIWFNHRHDQSIHDDIMPDFAVDNTKALYDVISNLIK